MRFVSIYMVHPYTTTDTTTAFILSNRSDFHMVDSHSIAVHTFTRCILTSLSVDEIFLLRYVSLSTNFRGQLLRVEMAPLHSKHKNSVLFVFTWSLLLLALGNTAGIQLEQMYLQEVLDYLHSLCLS